MMKMKLALIGSLVCNLTMVGFDDIPIGSTVQVAFAQKGHIDMNCAQINKEINTNAWVRCVAKGAVGVTMLAACCLLFKDITFTTGVHLNKIQEQTLENKAVLQIVISKFPDLFKDKNLAEFVTDKKEGWGSTILGFATGFACNTAFGFIYSTIKSKVFYDQTIQWFVKDKTMLPRIYEEIKTVKTDIDFLKQGKHVISKIQADRYVNMLVGLHNNIVGQLEQVIAYLRYKVTALNLKLTDIQGNVWIADFLFARINAVAQKLYDAEQLYVMQQKEEERVLTICQMFDTIEQFSLELNSSLGQFALLEQKIQDENDN
ncbi:MAG: hypothetical protein WD055_06460 [Candidatus Dependentiae bacterium]